MKVTKAKGLNTDQCISLRQSGPAGHLAMLPKLEAATHSTASLRVGSIQRTCAELCGRGTPRPARRVRPRADVQRRCQVARWTVYPQRADFMRIEVLCFGDFHLDQQMKVTRLPGRNPARNANS
jgi:hypothetical protein